MSFAEEVIAHPPESWEEIFQDKDISTALRHIFRIIDRKGAYVPYQKDIFRAFRLVKKDNVSVVILGQDPYHQIREDGHPRACGLSFSVFPEDPTIPQSLKVIYQELKRCYPNFIVPDHGDLSSLAAQGVLWLNASLTCKRNEPDSHKKVWHSFTIPLLRKLLSDNPKVVFLAFGRNAQKLLERYQIGEIPGVKVLETDHPVARKKTENSLVGSGVFEKCNQELTKMGKSPIDWCSIPRTLTVLEE